MCKLLVKGTDLRDRCWRRELPRFNDMRLEYDEMEMEMEMADGLKSC